MPTRNPLSMEPDQIVGEITHLRDGIDQSSRRILELSRTLHDRMRRENRARLARSQSVRSGTPESNEATRTGLYLTYANLWTRFASMVQQGLQRSRQADRVIRLLPDEAPVLPTQAEAEAAPEPAPEAQTVPTPSPLEDFITLYGEEMMRDASAERERER